VLSGDSTSAESDASSSSSVSAYGGTVMLDLPARCLLPRLPAAWRDSRDRQTSPVSGAHAVRYDYEVSQDMGSSEMGTMQIWAAPSAGVYKISFWAACK
jgi:hypothetical protein